MKKRYPIILTLLATLFILPPWLLGFSLLHLGHAVQVATSLSAKLGCSAYFISGFSKPQIVSDLSSYSPATQLVDLTFDDNAKTVNAQLFGLAEVTAEFQSRLGCRMRVEPQTPLPAITVPEVIVNETEEWPMGNKVESTIDPKLQQITDRLLRADNNLGLNTRALLVVKVGKLVAESYSDGITTNTPLLGWSMAKSVTAMMVGTMEQTGLLKREQQGLFQSWQGDQRSNISLASLLNMTSGLAFDETYAPGSDATHMLFTADNASDVALQSKQLQAPDQYFSYSSGTTNIINRLIHHTLGNSSDADQLFLSQKLWKPAKINTAHFETDASGILIGSSYLYASARDWARLGLIWQQDGWINGTQVLPRGWVKAATTPNKSQNEKAYGYQIWLNQGDETLRWPNLPKDAYAMRGNRQQSVMIVPSAQVVLVRLGWTQGEYPMAQNYRAILDKL